METPDRFMNTEKTENGEPTDSPKAIDIPARAKPRKATPSRKIDAVTIAEMAKLCAKMLTESEACRRLDIKPRTWFDFKSRAGRNQQFADVVEAYRAARIEQLIARIEASADGDGVKFPDWRAALALLKITDQRRFGDSPTIETTVNQTNYIAGDAVRVKQLIAMFAGQVQVQPPAAPKQIAAADAVEVEAERVK